MKLYRYMAFDPDILRDTVVGNGFAAQYASCFDDAFEGAARIKIEGVNQDGQMRLAPSALVQHYSILCFNKPDETEPNQEMLMWSLYANKNYGVRIVVDLPWSESVSRHAVMGNVRYNDIVPVVQVKSRSVDEILKGRKSIFEQAETISRIFFVKHTCWQWEKEYRVVIENVEKSNEISMSRIKEDQPARYCAEFLKSYIKGIDFGLNLWRDEETKVRQFIDAMRKDRSDLIFRRPVLQVDQKCFSFKVID